MSGGFSFGGGGLGGFNFGSANPQTTMTGSSFNTNPLTTSTTAQPGSNSGISFGSSVGGGLGGFNFGSANPQTTMTSSLFNTNLLTTSTTAQPGSNSGISFGSSGIGGNASNALGGGTSRFSGLGLLGSNTQTTTASITSGGSGLLTQGLPSLTTSTNKPSGFSLGGFSNGFNTSAQSSSANSVMPSTQTASTVGFTGSVPSGGFLGSGSAAPTTVITTNALPYSLSGTSGLGGSIDLGGTSGFGGTGQSNGTGGLKLGPVAIAPTSVATLATDSLGIGSTTMTSTGTPGSFSFGINSTQPPITQLSAAPSTTSSTTMPGFNLGGLLSTTLAATASTTSFGLPSTSVPATATTSSTMPGFTLSFSGGSFPVSAPASVPVATVITSATASSMNYRQLEEAINKWTQELEEQEAMFLEQATQVNAWDRLLIENGDMITQLNANVEKVKADQQHLDQELDFILGQQNELEDMLKPLEQMLEQLPPITYQQHADLEREHTYKLAENVDSQLKCMASDLKEIVEHLNADASIQDISDPLVQIAKILNAHVDSLQWIDQKTGVLQGRVEDVARLANAQRKQQTFY